MDQITITLRRACACAIPAALEGLAARVRPNMGPFRAYCPILVVLRIEDYMVPVGLQAHRHGKLQSWGIYRKLPAPGDPLGQCVLIVTTALCPNCQATATPGWRRTTDAGAAGGSQSPCGCDGRCCEELQVHFTYGCEFPLLPHEVRWFFFDWFGMHEEAWAALPQNYRKMADIYEKYDTDSAGAQQPARSNGEVRAASDDRDGIGDGGDAAGGPQPARRRKAGAPLLICNRFLLDEMRATPRQLDYRHLRPRWLELYVMQMGSSVPRLRRILLAKALHCKEPICRSTLARTPLILKRPPNPPSPLPALQYGLRSDTSGIP